MNPYEKQGILQDLIKEAEWRLGSYLVTEGTEKTDTYAVTQIKRIYDYSQQLNNLYKEAQNGD